VYKYILGNKMFKVISFNKKLPDDHIVIAIVYEDDDVAVEKIILNLQSKKSTMPMDFSMKWIKQQVLKTPNTCPYCSKNFTGNLGTMRHIQQYCKIRKLKQLEQEEMEDIDNTGYTNSIELSDGKYIKNQYPNVHLRDICYVAGSMGSGKSYYCKNYINDFKVQFPKKSIILLSRIEEDESFRDMIQNDTIISFDLNDESIIENPIDVKKEMNDSLLIFDDYDTLDKKIAKSVEITLNDTLLNGRDQSNKGLDIYCLVTGHQIMNYQKTRAILNECSSITFFPRSGGIYHITRCLKVYLGCDKHTITKILNLESRWVTVYKRYPNWCLYEHGLFKM